MNSSSRRIQEQKQSQDDIRRQIALLQAQLGPEPEAEATCLQKKSPKRKAEVVTLAPATPSPKKKRKILHSGPSAGDRLPAPSFKAPSRPSKGVTQSGKERKPSDTYKKPPPSALISKLSGIKQDDTDKERSVVTRTSGFMDRPGEPSSIPKRDERLAIVEDLEPGPYEHNLSDSDPEFKKLEPHSGIRLMTRIVPHEDFSDYLRGRYYLSPSRLYSIVRLLPDKQGYDVPVPGDWVTVAVVAERGPIRYTKAPVTLEESKPDPRRNWKTKNQGTDADKPSGGKKFVNIKLIDFGARTSSSATGGKSAIRGDAYLTLLLFESDAFDLIPRDDGRKPEKLYRGGSRGAFERLTDTKEGDVIALLNPKILKPFQRAGDRPHPTENILALTPENASSIMVLGRARDLGMCTARKDGKTCGSWCDRRVSDVCEYHVFQAVTNRRTARSEFAVGTSGMSTSAKHKNPHEYDPRKKWGLQPKESSSVGATYVISGHVVSGSSSDPRTLYDTEDIGREGQAKAKRLMEQKEGDRALQALLNRDKDGMRTVMKAREVGEQMTKREKRPRKGAKQDKGKETVKGKAKKVDSSDEDDISDGEESAAEVDEIILTKKSAYKAEFVKALGFDPSFKSGTKKPAGEVQNKLNALDAVRSSRKTIALGPRPGPRIRSGVVVPVEHVDSTAAGGEDLVDLDHDDDQKMVDLDDL